MALYEDEESIKSIEFKKICSHMNTYMSMFKMIQIQYNEILRVSEELYQIVDIYIQNFITKKNEVRVSSSTTSTLKIFIWKCSTTSFLTIKL